MTMDSFALFSTPLFVFDLADMSALNHELATRLGDERMSSPGLTVANAGGWHSLPDLGQRPEPCYRALFDLVVRHVSVAVGELARASGAAMLPRFRYGVHGWAVILDDGDYVILHDHGDAHWSTVYYVDAGDDGATGKIAFVDPRRGGRPIPGVELFPTTFTVQPRASALIVFPGWLQHYVHPYRGARPRISISCNLVLEPAR
jgi:uncharacterized protein (TIGR02466 family)